MFVQRTERISENVMTCRGIVTKVAEARAERLAALLAGMGKEIIAAGNICAVVSNRHEQKAEV